MTRARDVEAQLDAQWKWTWNGEKGIWWVVRMKDPKDLKSSTMWGGNETPRKLPYAFPDWIVLISMKGIIKTMNMELSTTLPALRLMYSYKSSSRRRRTGWRYRIPLSDNTEQKASSNILECYPFNPLNNDTPYAASHNCQISISSLWKDAHLDYLTPSSRSGTKLSMVIN